MLPHAAIPIRPFHTAAAGIGVIVVIIGVVRP